MLPGQYSSSADRRAAEPHRRLMAAVLQAVVDDCRDGTAVELASDSTVVDVRGPRNAIAYVASGDRDWPFSFENLCDALGLDADSLRDELNVKCAPAPPG
jgi:hypothetical protein